MPLGVLFRRKSTGLGQDVPKSSDQPKPPATKGGKEGRGRILPFGKRQRQSSGAAHLSSSTESTTNALPETQPPKAVQPAKPTSAPKLKKNSTTTIKKKKPIKKKKANKKDTTAKTALSSKDDGPPSKALDTPFDERDVGEKDWSDASDSRSFDSYTSSGGSSRSSYSSRSSRRSTRRSLKSSYTSYSDSTGSSRSSYSSRSYDDCEDYSNYTSGEGDGGSFYDESPPGRSSTDRRWKQDPAMSQTRSDPAATIHSSRPVATNNAKSKSQSEPKPLKSRNKRRTKNQREPRREPFSNHSEDSSNDDSTHGGLLSDTEIEQRTMEDQEADPDKLRLQKMIAQLQKEDQILETKLGDRRHGDSGDKHRERQVVKGAKLIQQRSIKSPRHMLDGSSNHNNSPYNRFVKPSAAQTLQPPAFEPSKSPLGTPVSDAPNAPNDPRACKQLQELAEKMREIGIDPEDIGIGVESSSQFDLWVPETSMPEVAAPEEQHPPRSSIEPCEQVPVALLDDLGAQMAIAQQRAIARLEKKIEQRMDESTSSRAGRQSSNGSLRASNKRLQAGFDNRKDTTQRTRPNEGNWLFEHLSLKSGRTNRLTPSETANVGLFIDSPSVRNSFRNERKLERYGQMDPKSVGAPLKPGSKGSNSRNELTRLGSHDAGSASSSSCSSHFTSFDETSYNNLPINRPARNGSKLSPPSGGVRHMEENRTSYKCLADFIEEQEPEGPEDLASKRARSLTSNRHSFKSLTEYEEETQLREKVFSKFPVRSPKSSYHSLVEYEKVKKAMNEVPKPSKGEPLGLSSARRSYRSFSDIQEGHEALPESNQPLYVQQNSPCAFPLDLLMKRVPSVISVPSSGATANGDDQSEIFPPSALTASVASDVHTKRSVDPPEVRNSQPTAKLMAMDRVEDMDTTPYAAESAPIPIQSAILPPTQTQIDTSIALAMPPSVEASFHHQVEINPSSHIDKGIQSNRTLEDSTTSDDDNGSTNEDIELEKKHMKKKSTKELNFGRKKSLSPTRKGEDIHSDKRKNMSLSKESHKTVSQSPLETLTSHSDERLRKLSSRKEEKEKALQKLLRSKSLSSSERLGPRRRNSRTTKSSRLSQSEHGALRATSKHEKKSIRPTHYTSLGGFENSEHPMSSRDSLENKKSARSLSADAIGKGGKSKSSSQHGERSAESCLCSSSKKKKTFAESMHSTIASGRSMGERKSSGRKDRDKAENITKSPRELDLESLCTSKVKKSRDRSGKRSGKDKKISKSSKSHKESRQSDRHRRRDEGQEIKRRPSKKGFHEFTIALAIPDEGTKGEKRRDKKHISNKRSSRA